MSLRLHMEHWPVAVVVHDGDVNDAEVDEFLRASDNVFLRQQRFAMVFDSSRAGKVSSYMRKGAQEWLSSHADVMKRDCVGSAFVFSSPAMRFILSTTLLFSGHITPHIVCGTVDEGFSWARKQLAGSFGR